VLRGEESLGADATSTLDTIEEIVNLGRDSLEQGKLDEAEETYRQALQKIRGY
jgi:hypothetical protein